MSAKHCNIVTEDQLSEAVLRALISWACPHIEINISFPGYGFGAIKKNIMAYNNAAKGTPCIALVDLDNTECAPSLVRNWMQDRPRHPDFLLRVAVREVEAWLLAHREGIADFLGLQINQIPQSPDALDDPKRKLIQLAKKSRKAALRRAIVPIGSGRIGPDYNNCMTDFVSNYWEIVSAESCSNSLTRAIASLRSFARRNA